MIAPELATELGVIAPKVNEIAGVVVGFATVPETPLAVVTETEVTVPVPLLGQLEPLCRQTSTPPIVIVPPFGVEKLAAVTAPDALIVLAEVRLAAVTDPNAVQFPRASLSRQIRTAGPVAFTQRNVNVP